MRSDFNWKRRNENEKNNTCSSLLRFVTIRLSWWYQSWYVLKVITDDTFAQHEGFDLATFDEKNWPPSKLPSFRVLKQETYSTFKSRVAQHFSYPENQIRLWVLVNRQNKTVRPDTPIPENEPTLSWCSAPFFRLRWSWSLAVEVIRNNMAARQNDLRLYLDIIPDPSKVLFSHKLLYLYKNHI